MSSGEIKTADRQTKSSVLFDVLDQGKRAQFIGQRSLRADATLDLGRRSSGNIPGLRYAKQEPLQWTVLFVFIVGLLALALIGIGSFRKKPPSDIEQKVSQWIDALRLNRKILVDEKAYFGFQVSLPPRIIVSILRQKNARLILR